MEVETPFYFPSMNCVIFIIFPCPLVQRGKLNYLMDCLFDIN